LIEIKEIIEDKAAEPMVLLPADLAQPQLTSAAEGGLMTNLTLSLECPDVNYFYISLSLYL
jgi:hypothetical protein